MAFITSQGVLDAPSNMPIREYMMRHANLVGVARLPNNLLTENAGTEVDNDLIILQKNSSKKGKLYYNEKLFVKTDIMKGTDPYGKLAYRFMHRGGMAQMAEDLREHLNIELQQLDKELYERYSLHPTQVDHKNIEVQPTSGISVTTSQPANDTIATYGGKAGDRTAPAELFERCATYPA